MHQVSIQESREAGKHSVVISSESSTLIPALTLAQLRSLSDSINTYIQLTGPNATPAGTKPYHSQYL